MGYVFSNVESLISGSILSSNGSRNAWNITSNDTTRII
jgi:hypothetical protein